jgi:hypothetical protein
MKHSHLTVKLSLMKTRWLTDDENNVTGIWDRVVSRSRNFGSVPAFTWIISELKIQEAPHVNVVLHRLQSFFFFFFGDVIQLLVTETDIFYLDTLNNDSGSSKLLDVMVQEMCVSFSLIIQMGLGKWDTLKDYWSTLELFYWTFYSNMIKMWFIFCHVLNFIHSRDNINQPDKANNNHDRLWKIRSVFDMLSDNYAEIYIPSEHVSVVEVILLINFQAVHCWEIWKLLYKTLCIMTHYTCNLSIYMGKNGKMQHCWWHLHMWQYFILLGMWKVLAINITQIIFSTLRVYFMTCTWATDCCGTVRQNRKGRLWEFGARH